MHWRSFVTTPAGHLLVIDGYGGWSGPFLWSSGKVNGLALLLSVLFAS
jgi:hypothetical protein